MTGLHVMIGMMVMFAGVCPVIVVCCGVYYHFTEGKE